MAFVYIYPPQSVSVATPPIQYELDGLASTVSRDTVTPSNSNPLPVINLDSSGNPASPLTDAELRATPVPVSGPLTNTELRSSAVPVSASALPLPSGAATEATLSAINGKLPAALGQQSEATSFSVTLSTENESVLNTILTELGEINTDTPPLIGGRVPVDGSGVTQPISAASLPLPTGASTLAEQQAQSSLIGAVNETAPATDTASSGLNGRLQRIAQRITSLISLFPATLGQKTMANSFAVSIASDQSALSVTQTALTPTFQEITNLTISAQTFTAPAGAKWCKVYAPDTNSVNVRIKLGGTATITSGVQLQPGRSEDFAVAGNISVIAESSTNQQVNVTFGA